jgi:hypothetical protein
MRAMMASVFEEMVPHVDDSSFSESERQQADSIALLLHSLNGFISDFRSDLELFDYAESHPDVMMRWSAIACRDAAMTIWNFRDALDHIQRAVKQCLPLKTKELERSLRAAIGRYGAMLPMAKKMRNVTGHPVSHIGTPEAWKQNVLRGTSVLVHNSWAGRKVIHSKEGMEISFELSEDTLEALITTRNKVFAAFR